MHLTQEPDRQGEAVADTGEPVLHGEDVVAHFCGVVSLFGRRDLTRLEAQQLADIGPRAFDP